MSDIEGKAAREAVSECGQRANFNGATGVSDPAPAGPRGSGEGDGNRPNTIVKALHRESGDVVKRLIIEVLNS